MELSYLKNKAKSINLTVVTIGWKLTANVDRWLHWHTVFSKVDAGRAVQPSFNHLSEEKKITKMYHKVCLLMST